MAKAPVKKKVASKTASEAPDAGSAGSGQGRAVILPDGERRIDYIRRRFFDDSAKRGDIARELTELTGQKVAYQIVFAATKPSKKDEDAE